jgi:hypothetical protein
VEAPRGWKVQGGLLRKGPLDPRAEVDMVSPDGRIDMRLGDWGIPPFTVPSGQMERLGDAQRSIGHRRRMLKSKAHQRRRSVRNIGRLSARASQVLWSSPAHMVAYRWMPA